MIQLTVTTCTHDQLLQQSVVESVVIVVRLDLALLSDGWLDHQPGPPDAASAAEILRRTERASAINRSERPSENVFNEVGSMEGGISAGTTEAGTIAHRLLQSNLIMGLFTRWDTCRAS